MVMTTDVDLKALIASHKGRRSYERLSLDCGGTPTAARLHQLATIPQKNFPDPDTIAGLARGLGVPVTEVVMCAARSLGLRVSSGYDPDALVLADAGLLSNSARDAITTLVREMHKLSLAAQPKEREGDGRKSAATNPAGSAPAEPSRFTVSQVKRAPTGTRTEASPQPLPAPPDQARP